LVKKLRIGGSWTAYSRKGWNDRKFLEALQYFVASNITWRALPEKNLLDIDAIDLTEMVATR
jgi:hypothetical protein